MARRTIPQCISFQPEIWDFLEKKKNKSEIVNEAIKEYKEKRTIPEQKIKLLKQQKREFIKKINEIDEEIKSLK